MMRLNHNRQKNVWEFETEQLQGFIQPEGERHGVKQILHKPTGIQVVHPLYDVFNLFFLFSTNLCMGQARLIERSIRAEGDVAPVADEIRAMLKSKDIKDREGLEAFLEKVDAGEGPYVLLP